MDDGDKSLVTWNVMIHGYMKSGKIELAAELFETMPKRSLISWNSMIDGYQRNGCFMKL